MSSKYKKCLSVTFTCRRILSIMVVSGFIVNSMVKSMFGIVIVAMVKKPNSTDPDLFEWSEDQKQNVMGIFFWGFALTKIPSGRLAETFGSRKVTGYSMLSASLLTILTPTIASFNYYLLLASRVLMGFLLGASWPAVMPLAAKWVPIKEHSVFISCITATSLGTGIVFYICGFFIHSYGWRSVFYLIGGLALLWSIAWFFLIYDSPQQHPLISEREKRLIESAVKNDQKQTKFTEIPWKQIGKSCPVWAITAAQMAIFFGYTSLLIEMPSFMDQVLHIDIKQNGIFSGIPYLGGYFASVVSGYLADSLIKNKKLSTTSVRKLFATISLLIPGSCMLLLALRGDSSTVAVTTFSIGLTANAISSAGHCANILDISPNFAGTICGIVNTVAAFSVYIATKLVALLLEKGHTFQEWRNFFWILFGIYMSCNVVYLLLASAKLQHWDSKYVENKGETEVINIT